MITPTCPTCHAPQTATDALPFAECPYRHTEAVWLPRSRFVEQVKHDLTPLLMALAGVGPVIAAMLT